MSDQKGHVEERIEKLNSQVANLLKKAEIAQTNASLAKLKSDHLSYEEHLENCKLFKKKALKKQKKIEILLSQEHEQDCESEDDGEYCETGESTHDEHNNLLAEQLKQTYLEPIQMAIEMLENGEVSKELRNIELHDLQIAESIVQCILSDNSKIFEAIREIKSVHAQDEEEQDEEIYDSDEMYEEEEDEDVDSEVENEIYGEIESELGYDFNKESDDEENLD